MRIGATPEPNDSKLTNNQQPIDNGNESSVWAKFNDDNNKVDISDVNYVMNNNIIKKSSFIENFLKTHNGETWTKALKDEIGQLVARFNLECDAEVAAEGLESSQDEFDNFLRKSQEDFKNFQNSVNNEFDNSKKSFGLESNMEKTPETGRKIAVMCEDGSSIQVDLKNNTVTKFSSDGQLVGQRVMTDEEKALSSQELINKLQKNLEIESQASTNRNITENEESINIKQAENNVATNKVAGNTYKGPLTLDQIRTYSQELKPGESFGYTVPNGGGYGEFIVKREQDGTIVKINSGNRTVTKFDSNCENKIFEQFMSGDILYTRNYDEAGKPISVVTKLDSELISAPPNMWLTLPRKVKWDNEYTQNYSNERYVDKNGNNILIRRDGQYFKPNGREISEEQAVSLLMKSRDAGLLSKLIQEY